MPDPTSFVMSCLICDDWHIDAPPRARAALGVSGVTAELVEAGRVHQLDAHPDRIDVPIDFHGAPVLLDSGKPATGGLFGYPLPRWWDWITAKGTR